MRWLHSISVRFRSLFRKAGGERELNDELRFHLERTIEQNLARGMTAEEARRRALIEIGGVEQVREECRDARGLGLLHDMWRDVRYGARMLRKNPGFTFVAVLTLALGIGANTTIFSVIDVTLLKTLPFPNPNRLALVWETYGNGPDDWNIVSAPNFWDWQRQNHVFESMAIFDSAGKGYNLAGEPGRIEPEQVSGLRVTAGFFNVLGVQPFLGRGFLPEEETLGKDHEVVLSYGLWQRRYGGDPALVGKTIPIDGLEYTLVGVMPRNFEFEFWSHPRQLWVPAGYTKGDYERDSNSFVAIARLRPGVTFAQAQTEMKTIGARLAQQYPRVDGRVGVRVMPMGDFGLENLQQVMLTLLAAVSFVLLIACVNLANLLLARGASRQKEFAIRMALGAAGSRIVRQLLTESVLLAILGAGGGLLLSVWSVKLLTGILPVGFTFLPFRPLDGVSIDMRVFGFTLLVACLAGTLFGLAPAWSACHGDSNEQLKEGGRGSTPGGGSRLRHVLVASEVALALVVLSGAGLMIETMSRLINVDPGFNTKNVLTMEMSLPQINTYYGPPVDARFCEKLTEQVGTIPGIVSVGAAAHLPLEGNAGRGFVIEGQPAPAPGHEPGANYSVACPGYFRTMGVPTLQGREFNSQDTLGSPGVVVINQAMAQKFWPHEDALGKRIRVDGADSNGPWLTVVGIAGNMRHWGLDEPARPQFFRPYTQAAWPWMTIVVRTASSPAAFLAPIKQAMTRVEPNRAVSGVETMQEVVSGSLGSHRFPMLLLASFGLVALLLAAVGILGVVSYSTAQRTHEVGIRMALGAQAGDVLRLIVRGSMTWVLVGMAGGMAGSVGLTRLIGSLLYGVKPTDPFVLGGASALLAGVALLASYVPARRAMRVDPMTALRHE
ncbi:MAG: ABC transporter permease [Acidobacteriota bacterium]|nr:ABC transporter permease [Acidobacteriota bacterium]